MNECNKLSLIRAGDVVGFLEQGKTVYREVQGWKTQGRERYLELAWHEPVPLSAVLSRRRVQGCGKGEIVFESEMSA